MKRFWKLAALSALPLVLLALALGQNRWRPRTVTLGAPEVKVARFKAGNSTVVNKIALDTSNATLAFSPDGQTLRVGLLPPNQTGVEPYEIQLWNVSPKRLQQKLSGTTQPTEFGIAQVALSPDGAKVAIMAPGGALTLGNSNSQTAGQKLAVPAPNRWTRALLFSPDAQILAQAQSKRGGKVATIASEVLLWNTRTHQLQRTLNANIEISQLLFSPDGGLLIGSDWLQARVWDVKTGVLLYQLQTFHRHPILSADGKTLAVVNKYGKIILHEARSGKTQTTIDMMVKLRISGQPDRSFEAYFFAPDGKTLATLHTLHPSYYGNVKWTPGLNDAQNSVITLWDVSSGALVRSFKNGRAAIDRAAFAPDGQTLASVNQSEVIVWNARTGQPLQKFKGQTDHTSSLAFAPDSRTLAVAYRNGTNRAMAREVIRRIQVRATPAAEAIAVSSVGALLLFLARLLLFLGVGFRPFIGVARFGFGLFGGRRFVFERRGGGIAQFFAGHKTQGVARGDIHRLAGLRVARLARGTVADLERAKTGHANLAAGRSLAFDGGLEGFDDLVHFLLRQIHLRGHRIHNISPDS